MVPSFTSTKKTGYPYKSHCITQQCKLLQKLFAERKKQAVSNDRVSKFDYKFTTAPRPTVARKGMVYRFGQSSTTRYPYKSNCSTRKCRIVHERFAERQKRSVRNGQSSLPASLQWLAYYINSN